MRFISKPNANSSMGGVGTEFPFSCGGFETAVSKFITTPDKNLTKGSAGQDRLDMRRLDFWRRSVFTFSMGHEKMKVQRWEWCRQKNLIPLIAAGQLRSETTEPFIYGTYLELWWRCLKSSKEFTQSSRTGIFTSKGAYTTFCMFGNVEDMTFQDWWMTKGHEFFSESITTLQVTLFVKRKNIDAFQITVDAFQDVSSQLAGKEFGFWLDQICLLNARAGLLSEAPLSWPIFHSRISYNVIALLLSIVETHEQIIRNAPETNLWQIGEQLRLNPKAMPKVGDFTIDIANKHKAMGQTVSNYLRKGRGLIDNASKGIFPRFTSSKGS